MYPAPSPGEPRSAARHCHPSMPPLGGQYLPADEHGCGSVWGDREDGGGFLGGCRAEAGGKASETCRTPDATISVPCRKAQHRPQPSWAPTCLQGGERLRLLAVLAVPDVICRFHTELVGSEGLEPEWEQSRMGAVRPAGTPWAPSLPQRFTTPPSGGETEALGKRPKQSPSLSNPTPRPGIIRCLTCPRRRLWHCG